MSGDNRFLSWEERVSVIPTPNKTWTKHDTFSAKITGV